MQIRFAVPDVFGGQVRHPANDDVSDSVHVF